jgi:hypothetical protein
MTFVTTDTVRRTCGILSSEISDADINAIIAECEPQIERFYNTVFTPKTRIEVRDGNDTNRMILQNNPVLAVRELKINNSTEDPANLDVTKGSGRIVLSSRATSSTFINSSYKIIVKYIYGFLEESSTSTTTSEAEVAGSAVSVAVASSTGFTDLDWVEIYGMDGYREAAQVSSVSTGILVLDKLIYSHESGSTIVKLEISEIMKKLINIACAIACVARIIGQSYTDIVGYGLGELNVQKGEPYTQWRETASQLIAERDEIMSRIRPRPCVV